MFGRVTHASLGLVVVSFFAATVPAQTALAAPPPISQYVEQIPTASGSQPAQAQNRQAQNTPESQPPGSTSARTSGPANRATQHRTRDPRLRGLQPPAPAKTPSVIGAAFSSDKNSSGVGRGILLAFVLATVSAVALVALAVRRR